MLFLISMFYTFFICLVWNSIVRLPISPETVHVKIFTNLNKIRMLINRLGGRNIYLGSINASLHCFQAAVRLTKVNEQ